MKRYVLPKSLKGKISEENYNRWLYREVKRIYEVLTKLGCKDFIPFEKLLEVGHQAVEKKVVEKFGFLGIHLVKLVKF